MHALPPALAALAPYRQFIVYQLVPKNDGTGKVDKKPLDYRTGRMPEKGAGGPHDPAIWTDHETACACAARWGGAYGVGFVFTEADPFFFLDLDGCLIHDAQTKSWDWSPVAKQLCTAFNGAFIEVSQSGRGLHIIGTGTPPPHRVEIKTPELSGGLYDSFRFCALTGTNAQGDAGTDHTAMLGALVSTYFPPRDGDHIGRDDSGLSDAPDPEWRGPIDDADLISRAMRSTSARSAFGNHASFSDLWTRNVEVLAACYPAPDANEGPYNGNQVDMALAQHLAFWTGKHGTRIVRLMWQSALVRGKWDREDYIPRTVRRVLSLQRDILTDKTPEERRLAVDVPDDEPVSQDIQMVTGNTFLGPEEQVNLFRGCIYIQESNSVFTPGGTTIDSSRFRVAFGGYTFIMDNEGRRTSRDAWEAFTQSQAFRAPRAETTCFRPALPPGHIIKETGQRRVNTYWNYPVPRRAGDASLFLLHLSKVLPDERDREILLSYMSACVQHKGVKFQWAPLLQGVEGNGKTLFTRCVVRAVGDLYSHFPPASDIGEKFNSWMFGKLVIGIEDIYIPESRLELWERLKPMITGERQAERAMHSDQVMRDVCANFMINSNHQDAVRKNRNDRRLAPFFTPQQAKSDLSRDGMGGDYFARLYRWLNEEHGYAIVSELLYTRPICPEFNPASGGIAPLTSSTEKAIAKSLGRTEQEIQEAIEQGLPGFARGWVSSLALEKLLDAKNIRITHNKRREFLQQMGYDWHPGLPEGRVNNNVLPDNGKPKLFIHEASPFAQIRGASEIARAYSEAQGVPAPVPVKN